MSILVSDLSYHYFNQQPLFEHVSFAVASNRKVSVVGDNGTGKSTLLKLLAGLLNPSSGSICCSSQPYYIPQQIGLKGQSVSEALCVSEKINALHSIYDGSSEQIHYDILADDWSVETRCYVALEYWGVSHLDLNMPIDLLSGGEKSKVFLAGLMIHKPDMILLDEPTNHLDWSGRQKLYEYVSDCKATVILVSHDLMLLNLLNATYELSTKGIKLYGGNYVFYKEQKKIEESALEQQIDSEETALRLARKKAREVKERQEKRTRQGEKNKSQIVPILRKTMLNKGENTGAKLNEKHSDIITGSQQRLNELRQKKSVSCELKIDFDDAQLHNGKLLIAANEANFNYPGQIPLWESLINVEIRSGERIHLTGDNGTGKTTLIRLFIGELQSTMGEIKRSDFSFIYLDQEYSQVHTSSSILELALQYNFSGLQEHEIKLRLNRALFPKDTWNKSCLTLSGGERMRLYLCCLMISNHVPDVFILDEPTNNLDLSSLSILTQTVKSYRGTLLVISHDRNFINQIGVTKEIKLK